MNYYIGMDGGGTKSILTAVDENGKEIAQLRGGPTNISAYTLDQVRSNIETIVNKLLQGYNLSKEECLGFCIGSAGIDKESDKPLMHAMIKQMGLSCDIQVVNDAEIILEAEKDCEAGVAIISGTGSIAYGTDKTGNRVKSGGWGHLLGDEGSGYWIANEAIIAAVRSADRRTEKTLLLDKILTVLEIDDPYKIIDFVYKDCASDKGKLASLSSAVSQAHQAGDAEASRILKKAGQELSLLGSTVLKQLAYEDKSIVVCSGGILQNNDFIFNNVKMSLESMFEQVQVVRLSKEPVWGAVKMAMALSKNHD